MTPPSRLAGLRACWTLRWLDSEWLDAGPNALTVPRDPDGARRGLQNAAVLTGQPALGRKSSGASAGASVEAPAGASVGTSAGASEPVTSEVASRRAAETVS